MGTVIAIIVSVLAVLLIGGFIFMWVFCMKIAKKQYANMFIRGSKEKWARGNSAPENLLDFVTILQEELVRAGVLPADYDFESHKQLVPMQPGDVPVTYADTTPLEQDFGFRPNTPLREGLRRFTEWYAEYYRPTPALPV